MNKGKLMVLFVCTANACRSQMAEGWCEHLKRDSICAFSAGVNPAGRVSGRAVAAMADAGVDISRHYAKSVEDLGGIDFDYVITLSEEARAYCPKFGGKTKCLHFATDDPDTAIGTLEQMQAAFIDIREQLRAFVESMPQSLLKI